MADRFKNLQAAARRRGLSVRKEKVHDDGTSNGHKAYYLYKGDWDKRGAELADLDEVRDEVCSYPLLSAGQ